MLRQLMRVPPNICRDGIVIRLDSDSRLFEAILAGFEVVCNEGCK